MRKIEILAPAGSFESLKAAVNASCDAVYIGGDLFGARAYANNLNQDCMLEAIDYVHMHDKSLFLTVNTLLKDDEIKGKLYDYIAAYYDHGLDAAIVQDLGVLHFLHANFPDLALHASTQMSLNLPESANFLKEYGVTRIVTSRELGLSEIRHIRDNTDLEIESFVHGALCYCYSGQCLMSSMIGGRSGNRGRCAQPCRMPYDLYHNGKKLSMGDQKYLLSPKDMCTLAMIPSLIEAGVDSFKIEGRMKRPEYTALAAHLYRKYVDLYQKLGEKEYTRYIEKNIEELEKDQKNLMDLYNRGSFTKGYYDVKNGKEMMALTRPNHNGVYVGKVVGVKANNALIALTEDVHAQDLLEIRKDGQDKKLCNSYEFTVKDGAKAGTQIRTNFYAKEPVYPQQKVYRLKNQELLDDIQSTYMKEEKKQEITGLFTADLNQKTSLTLCYRNQKRAYTVTVYGEEAMQAQKQSATKEQVAKQLNKLNTTPFKLKELTVKLANDLFIPNGQLNEIRRAAVAELEKEITHSFYRTREKKPVMFAKDTACIRVRDKELQKKERPIKLVVHLEDLRLLDVVLDAEGVDALYLNCDECSKQEVMQVAKQAKQKGIRFYITLPSVFRMRTKENFTTYFSDELIACLDGCMVKSVEEFAFVKERVKGEFDVILDYNVYTMNAEAKAFWNENGVIHDTTSLELTYQELKKLDVTNSDMIIYGHTTLMVSAQCVRKSTIGCIHDGVKQTKEESESPYYEIKDQRKNVFYARKHCRYCYNTIYNGKPLYLLNQAEEVKQLHPASVRLDFTRESKEEVRKILKDSYEIFMQGQKKKSDRKEDSYTKGHFNRGIE